MVRMPYASGSWMRGRIEYRHFPLAANSARMTRKSRCYGESWPKRGRERRVKKAIAHLAKETTVRFEFIANTEGYGGRGRCVVAHYP